MLNYHLLQRMRLGRRGNCLQWPMHHYLLMVNTQSTSQSGVFSESYVTRKDRCAARLQGLETKEGSVEKRISLWTILGVSPTFDAVIKTISHLLHQCQSDRAGSAGSVQPGAQCYITSNKSERRTLTFKCAHCGPGNTANMELWCNYNDSPAPAPGPALFRSMRFRKDQTQDISFHPSSKQQTKI